jgi:hypothetical protein
MRCSFPALTGDRVTPGLDCDGMIDVGAGDVNILKQCSAVRQEK